MVLPRLTTNNVGLHIYIWIQQQYEASIGENKNLGSMAFYKRNEEVQTALRKWREGWNATLDCFPSSKSALYQKSAVAFWFLVKYFNEVRDTRQGLSLSNCGPNRQKISVGRLLQAIFMSMDGGRLNKNSLTSAIKASDVGDTEVRANSSLDAMNIQFLSETSV
jgi:hypothetical protein